MQSNIWHIILAIIIAAIWGINFVIAKIALAHLPAFFMLLLRFLLIAIVLIPFYPRPPLPMRSLVAIAMVFSVGHLGTMFWGLWLGLDASIAVIIQQLGVPFLLILGVLFFREVLKWNCIFGLVITFIGTIVLVDTPNSIAYPFAFILVVASSFLWAVYSVGLKQLAIVHPMALIAWVALISIPMLLPLTLYFDSNHLQLLHSIPLSAFLALCYIALASMVHGLWYYLLCRNQLQHIAPFMLLIPLFGIVSAVLFLGESIIIETIVGGGLMTLGVGIITFTRRNANKEEEIS